MKKSFIKLHLSILIAGFTGIFGKLITLNEGMLVWYRLLITSILLYIILMVKKKYLRLPLPDILRIGFVGVLLCLHWLFFYGSIKAFNVSIGVVCFSMTGFFTAILEPIVNSKKIRFRELLFSIVALLGIILIFNFDTRYRVGIVLGTVSSAFAAIFSITNKRVTSSNGYDWQTNLFYEMLGAFVFLSLVLPSYLHWFPIQSFLPSYTNLIYLVLFSVFCTIGLYMLQIQVLRNISAFTLNLSYNLEPIYSIVLAIILFNESAELNIWFYAGLGLIVFSVCLQTLQVVRNRKKLQPQE